MGCLCRTFREELFACPRVCRTGALAPPAPQQMRGFPRPRPNGNPGGVLVLANDTCQGRCPLSGTRPTVRALAFLARNGRRKCGERPMRDLAAAADRIDYWIRRHVIVSCYGTHPPSQSKLNSARDRRIGLSAIGQCLKDQYDALATPIPPHLAALVKQLETRN
jgi:hypothetical protein